MTTSLSTAQRSRLDRLADEDTEAKVVGWHGPGPLVRRAGGRLQVVTPVGRLNAVREDRL